MPQVLSRPKSLDVRQLSDEQLVTEIRRLVGVVRFKPNRRKNLEFLFGLLTKMAQYKEGRTYERRLPNDELDAFRTWGRGRQSATP